jgi:hypothetical protein
VINEAANRQPRCVSAVAFLSFRSFSGWPRADAAICATICAAIFRAKWRSGVDRTLIDKFQRAD